MNTIGESDQTTKNKIRARMASTWVERRHRCESGTVGDLVKNHDEQKRELFQRNRGAAPGSLVSVPPDLLPEMAGPGRHWSGWPRGLVTAPR